VFAVGDADQSIYRWRGADYRNVLRFEQDFADAQVIMLEQNYRSTQNILDLATAVIDRNTHRTPKQLFSERGPGAKISLHMAYDDRVEAAYVVEKIVELIAKGKRQPGDFAVMYRTNAQSRLLEEAFLHHGLRYKLVGAQRFYGRREVKDIIAYLRLVHNPQDEISLLRILSVPPRGIGDKTLTEIRMRAKQAGLTPGAWLLEVGAQADSPLLDDLAGRTANAVQRFARLLHRWAAGRAQKTPLELMDQILDDVDYQAYIDDGTDEGHERWENLMELRRLAADFQREDLAAFLEQVALVSDQDTLDENDNVPTLLTLHAAKGLEFPVVFIVGLNDGALPHSRSFDDVEAMEEERRLFYVGITRAEDRLLLVYAQNRSAYGFAEPSAPSRYLHELPEDLLDAPPEFYSSPTERRSVRAFQSMRWGESANSAAAIVQPRYHPGMRVEHPVWHEGMVLNSRVQNDDEIVDVFFESVGLKRVAASLANLEILPS
ncbi:MAG TPA: 3'-5' exonuclease, partial [Anaerolineales bacterium]|nr:3'-5' exonuclease [Anaerolineales bacterium]